MGRRFTDAEVRRIFGKAAEAEAQPRPRSRDNGLTLQELYAIGDEVGLDRETVNRAAAEVAASAATVDTHPLRSGPTTILHEDVVIPRALSNSEMRSLAAYVDQILGGRGFVTETGPWVEWRDVKGRLYVGMVRGEHETRIRAITDHARDTIRGSAGIGLVSILLLPAAGAAGIAGFAAGLAAASGAVGLYWKWRSRSGRKYLRELVLSLRDIADG